MLTRRTSRIRLKIWALTPERQFLKFHVYNPAFLSDAEKLRAKRLRTTPDIMTDRIWDSYLTGKTPPMLHVCKESRHLALQVYKRYIQSPYRGRTTIYIDPEVDAVMWPGSSLTALEYLHVKDTAIPSIAKQGIHIKTLAVIDRSFNSWIWEVSNLKFGHVEELVVLFTGVEMVRKIKEMKQYDLPGWKIYEREFIEGLQQVRSDHHISVIANNCLAEAAMGHVRAKRNEAAS